MKIMLRCHFVSPLDARAVAKRLGIEAHADGTLEMEVEAERVAGPFRTDQVQFSIWRSGPLVIEVGEKFADGSPYARLLHDDEAYGVKERRGGKQRPRRAVQGTLF